MSSRDRPPNSLIFLIPADVFISAGTFYSFRTYPFEVLSPLIKGADAFYAPGVVILPNKGGVRVGSPAQVLLRKICLGEDGGREHPSCIRMQCSPY